MKNILSEQLQNIATEFNQIVLADNEQIVCLLKQALNDEILAAYQYWVAKNNTRGTGKVDVDPQFEAHAYQEWEHAEDLIERIKQLGGFPACTMGQVVKSVTSHAACGACSHNVCDLLNVTIQAEKDAIELYKKIIAATQGIDPVTHRLAKQILSDQEQHKYDLQMLKEDVCGCEVQEKCQCVCTTENVPSELTETVLPVQIVKANKK